MPTQPSAIAIAIGHLNAGHWEEARAALLRVLRKEPQSVRANAAMAQALAALGEAEQGLFYGRRALEAVPGDANLLNNVAHLCVMSGRTGEAVALYERGVEADAAHLGVRLGLTDSLIRSWRLDEARRRAEEALERFPGDARLQGNLAVALVQSGRAREALSLLRAASAQHPGDLLLAESLAGSMNYAGGVASAELLAAHRRYGELLREHAGAPLPGLPAPSDPDRPLRVGLLSGDLRAHAVSRFVPGLLALPAGFEVRCYSTGPEDAVSSRLRTMAAGWARVGTLSTRALAERIRADGVDILIELSGHTQGHRLGALALRPARVQISAVGYPSTTGVAEIGWRIVDSLTDPPGAEAHAVERLARVDPCFLAFEPPDGREMSDVRGRMSDVRSARGGPGVTFGCFGALAKYDDVTVRLWSRVLTAAPGARLLLKAMAFKDEALRAATLARFAAAGADVSRIEAAAPQGTLAEHLAAYWRVDVALDTYPYHGTTTTCEALWMGVPVVTLAGEASGARVGVSLLNAVGLGGLVARTEEEFVDTASALAREPARLAELRRELRERVGASPLCDRKGYGERFGAVLRSIWREECGRE